MGALRRIACAVVLSASACSLGGCYECGTILWVALTHVENSTTALHYGEVRLRTDAFLVRGPDGLELARPGANCGLPESVQAYRDMPCFWPGIEAVIEKGTRLQHTQRESHEIGVIHWTVEYASLTSGPHRHEFVRLIGFEPKEVCEGPLRYAYYAPNPDWFELANADRQPAARHADPPNTQPTTLPAGS